MEYHKGIMKTSLSENLRELMEKKLFEKITIKQICDETGVIRATFYNYFDDKYDCLNWIVHTDLLGDPNDETLIKDGRRFLKRAFVSVDKNRAFYKVAYNVTGQNSFEDMIRNNLAQAFEVFLDNNRKHGYMTQYDNRLLAEYYAESVACIIRMFVFDRNGMTVDTVDEMAKFLLSHSFMDFVE